MSSIVAIYAINNRLRQKATRSFASGVSDKGVANPDVIQGYVRGGRARAPTTNNRSLDQLVLLRVSRQQSSLDLGYLLHFGRYAQRAIKEGCDAKKLKRPRVATRGRREVGRSTGLKEDEVEGTGEM